MSSRKAICLVLGIFLIGFSSSINAQIPRLISYQGSLTDGAGIPVPDGNYDIVFRLYNDSLSGTMFWEEIQSVPVTGGRFEVYLGQNMLLADSIFTLGPDLFMGMQVIGEPSELSPRLRMASGAFAYHALVADLAGYAITAGSTDGWVDDGTTIRLIDAGDSVGIGTATPGAKLDVNGDVVFQGKATVGSYHSNTGNHAVISGGTSNTASGANAVIAGGDANTASSDVAVVSGGQGNLASGLASTVSGGAANAANGLLSTVAGGGVSDLGDPATGNRAVSDYSCIGGGGNNQAGDDMLASDATAYATIGGGESNTAMADHSTVGGGSNNQANGAGSNIGGGHTNAASGSFAAIGGGLGNQATQSYSTISGGDGNQANGSYATVSGGDGNTAGGSYSLVGGGSSNNADGTAAIIGGGGNNMATGAYSHIGGGSSNQADGNNSAVGGGWTNHAEADYSTVGGGQDNYATDAYCFVGGGRNNYAGDGAGDQNSAYYATVGGGFQNHAYGRYSTVAGGNNCTAYGQFSFAAGKMAKAKHDGTFVWADNTTENFESDTTNQFKIRAENGVSITTNTSRYGRGFYINNDGDGTGLDVWCRAIQESGWPAGISINNFGSGPALHSWQLNPDDSGYAGVFLGDVRIVGDILGSVSAVKLDHPLDPENMYLSHSMVSSQDMMNIYNGNVILDGQGEAWVELPNWFEALNKEYRYQLTCIGGHADVYIDQEIDNNRFKIAGGHAGLKVSWQVTGIRRDAYAEANRLHVEEYKEPDEQGTYLHPKAFGLGIERGVHYDLLQSRLDRLSASGAAKTD